MPPEKTGGVLRLPSTFYNAGYGTKAAYLALQRLDYPVGRLRLPIDESTLEDTGVLFVLSPLTGLTDDEAAALDQWIKAGHALVVVPSRWGNFGLTRSNCRGGKCGPTGDGPLDDWFVMEEPAGKTDKDKSDKDQAGKDKAHKVKAEKDDADRGVAERVFDEYGAGETVEVNLRAKEPIPGWHPDRSDPLTAGIGPLTAAAGRRFNSTAPLGGSLKKMPFRVFWKDKLGTVGLRVKYGQGTIIALADAYPLSNLGISRGDNGLLLGNVVRDTSERYPGTIDFDEYHLGFVQRDWSPLAIAKLTFADRWRWAMVQAALVGALAIFAGAVRFGSPRDIVLRKRRQHREFAESAGQLLNDAGALPLAAETLYGYYRGRLCRLVHLEPDADDDRLGRAVGERLGHDIDPLLREAGQAVSRPVGRQKLLAIIQKLHQVAEALDHGT